MLPIAVCSLIASTATLGVKDLRRGNARHLPLRIIVHTGLAPGFHLCVSAGRFALPDTSRSPRAAKGLGRVKTRSSFCVGTILSILEQKNQKHRTYMPGNRTLLAAIFGRRTFSHGLGQQSPCACLPITDGSSRPRSGLTTHRMARRKVASQSIEANTCVQSSAMADNGRQTPHPRICICCHVWSDRVSCLANP
jgi:hypothetical protein